MQTRLLYSVLPATWYAPKDSSIIGLGDALATDFMMLFEEGVPIYVAFPNIRARYILLRASMFMKRPLLAQVGGGKTEQYFASLIAVKGDWPWLRKVYNLQTGFQSRRICHLCPGDEPWNH